MSEESFHKRFISILLNAGFNNLNDRYFFRGDKQIMKEFISDDLPGYCFIASSSLKFQWRAGHCLYNEELLYERELLDRLREFVKEPVKEKVEDEDEYSED